MSRPVLTSPAAAGAAGAASTAKPVSTVNSVAPSPSASKTSTPQRRVSPPTSAGAGPRVPVAPPAALSTQQSFRVSQAEHARKRSSVDFSLMRKVFDEIDTDKSQKIDEGELINGLQKLGVGVTPTQLKRIVKAFRKSEVRRGHHSSSNNPMAGVNTSILQPKPFTTSSTGAGGDDRSGGGRPVMMPGMLKRGDTVRGGLMKQGTSSNLFAGMSGGRDGPSAITAAAAGERDSSGKPVVKWELDFNEFKRFVAFSEQDEKKDHIKVAVRMRPFSAREKSFGSKSCVSMENGMTSVADPLKPGKPPKSFDMDYTYNSSQPLDHFYAHQRFVCQEMVSDILDEALQGFNVTVFAYGQTGAGKSYTMFGELKETAAARLAAGPNAGANLSKIDQRGIIPHFCEQLFEYTQSNEAKEKNESYKISASMLEIYNDKVRDLGNPLDRDKPGGSKSTSDLKIRNHPDTGAYVAGLSLNPVANYTEAMRLITEGLEVRTESATLLNHTSSRAHTIFSITIRKTALSDDLFDSAGKPKLITTTSKINLVDLAGSERVKSKQPHGSHHDGAGGAGGAGAAGGPPKTPPGMKRTTSAAAHNRSKKQVEEGINVNKSLTVLGKCILALTVRASGSKIHVPFRDSTLTFLLKESLQGNSRTFMFANISPSSSEYEQTLSTLRFAQLAQSLQTKAVVNRDGDERVKLKLKTEIERLRKSMLEKKLQDAEYESMRRQLKEDEEVLTDVVAELEPPPVDGTVEAEKKAKQAKQIEDARLKAQQMRESLLAKRRTAPHFIVLHEDALVSEKLAHFLDAPLVRICREDSKPPPTATDIAIGGLQIAPEHATVTNSVPVVESITAVGILTLTVFANARTTVNGTPILAKAGGVTSAPVVLQHNDRVVFGSMVPGHVFRVVHPMAVFRAHKEKTGQTVDPNDIELVTRLMAEDSKFDFEFAAKEIAEAAFSPALKAKAAAEAKAAEDRAREYELKLKELEDKLAEEKRQTEERLKAKDLQLKSTLDDVERQQQIALNAARDELNKLAKDTDAKTRAVYEKRLKDREKEFAEKKQKAEDLARRQAEEIRSHNREAERILLAKQKEEAERQRKAEAERFAQAEFQDLLIRLIPLVAEANAIADELKQDRLFSIRPVVNTMDYDLHDVQSRVRIEVKTRDAKFTALWSYGLFIERVYMMKEIYNTYQEHRLAIECKSVDDNPFYFDTDEPEPIGTAKIFLAALYDLLDIKETYKLLNLFGETVGHLAVDLQPVLPPNAKPGQEFFDEADVKELFDKRRELTLSISIVKAMGIPERLATNAFATYRFWDDSTDQMTEACIGTTTNPVWATHKRTVKLPVVTTEFVRYVKDDSLAVRVWGYPAARDPTILAYEQWIPAPPNELPALQAAAASNGLASFRNSTTGAAAAGGALSDLASYRLNQAGGGGGGLSSLRGAGMASIRGNLLASPPVNTAPSSPGGMPLPVSGALSPRPTADAMQLNGAVSINPALPATTPRSLVASSPRAPAPTALDEDGNELENEDDIRDAKRLKELDAEHQTAPPTDDDVTRKAGAAFKQMEKSALATAIGTSTKGDVKRTTPVIPEETKTAKLTPMAAAGAALAAANGTAATTANKPAAASPGATASKTPAAAATTTAAGTKAASPTAVPKLPALPLAQLAAGSLSPTTTAASTSASAADLPDNVDALISLIPVSPVKDKLSALLTERARRDTVEKAERERTGAETARAAAASAAELERVKREAEQAATARVAAEYEQKQKQLSDAFEKQIEEMKQLRESMAARDQQIVDLTGKLNTVQREQQQQKAVVPAPAPAAAPPPAQSKTCVIL